MIHYTTVTLRIALLFFFMTVFGSVQAQIATITSTYGWTATIQLQPIQVVPSTLSCPEYYHYGIKYAIQVIFTGSTSNRVLNFNSYLSCSGGTGNEPFTDNFGPLSANYTGQRTSLLNNRQYTAVSTNNYGSNPSCTTITLKDANCTSVRVVYWGSGVADGSVTFPVTPYTPSPLPVELINFEGKEKGNALELNWSTASERENDYFTLEHSLDGTQFETIQTIKGGGTTSTQTDYKATDFQAENGVNYYRLSQTDYNGNTEYFDVIAVMYNQFSSIQSAVFPNPSQDGNVNLKLTNTALDDVSYTLYSIDGKAIETQKVTDSFSVIRLPKSQSYYFVEVRHGNEIIGRHTVSVL